MTITDEERFAGLFQVHYSAVMRYALRRVPADDADDLVAQTFLTAWRQLHRVPDQPLPWLYGVARHALLDRVRETQRRYRLEVRLSAQPYEVPLDSLNASTPQA